MKEYKGTVADSSWNIPYIKIRFVPYKEHIAVALQRTVRQRCIGRYSPYIVRIIRDTQLCRKTADCFVLPPVVRIEH